jgi:hypothetical protein
MNEIHVIENVVFPLIQDELEKKFLAIDFPLFFNRTTVPVEYDNRVIRDNNSKDYPYFSHTFIWDGAINSEYLDWITPISDSFLMSTGLTARVSRAKLNVTFPNRVFNDTDYFPPHLDMSEKGIVALYYVNDSDGDTLFFDTPVKIENKIDGTLTISDQYTPKKGNLVYFNETVIHANRPPINTLARAVINFNFIL